MRNIQLRIQFNFETASWTKFDAHKLSQLLLYLYQVIGQEKHHLEGCYNWIYAEFVAECDMYWPSSFLCLHFDSPLVLLVLAIILHFTTHHYGFFKMQDLLLLSPGRAAVLSSKFPPRRKEQLESQLLILFLVAFTQQHQVLSILIDLCEQDGTK